MNIEKEIEDIKIKLCTYQFELERLKFNMKAENKPDLTSISSWVKLLPYIVLGTIAIASLILQVM